MGTCSHIGIGIQVLFYMDKGGKMKVVEIVRVAPPVSVYVHFPITVFQHFV